MPDTRELIKKAQSGDKEARASLIRENMGLVYHIGKRFENCRIEKEDLIQIGSIGLMKAVDHFDLSMDVMFSTYAVPMIIGEIRRFLRDDGILKVSRSLKELGRRLRTEQEAFEEQEGREPDLFELADKAGISPCEASAALAAGYEVESIDQPVRGIDGDSGRLMDVLPCQDHFDETLVNRLLMEELLASLSGEEREIIIRRYYKNETQTKIAKELQITQVKVSRLEKKILKKLREKIREDRIKAE